LNETKRLVLLQSDIHRGLLQLETAVWRGRFAELRSIGAKVATHSPLLIAGAAVVGLLAMRHWRTLARWGPSVLTAGRWFRGFRGR